MLRISDDKNHLSRAPFEPLQLSEIQNLSHSLKHTAEIFCLAHHLHVTAVRIPVQVISE